jgi:hypothetical protein
MQYMLLLYASEAAQQHSSEAEAAALERDRQALAAELARTGKHRSAHALVHASSATTIRLRGGKTLLSDGPFADTPEQLLGLLLIEARDLDEAIAIAERAPDARLGSVEIRPVRETT